MKRRSGDPNETAQVTYKAIRTKLKRKIKRAKRQAWDRIVEALVGDIWGNAYQIARKKFRTERIFARTEEEHLKEANKLFLLIQRPHGHT